MELRVSCRSATETCLNPTPPAVSKHCGTCLTLCFLWNFRWQKNRAARKGSGPARIVLLEYENDGWPPSPWKGGMVFQRFLRIRQCWVATLSLERRYGFPDVLVHGGSLRSPHMISSQPPQKPEAQRHTAKHRQAVHRPRAPLSLAAPVPCMHLPVHARAPLSRSAPVPSCTFPCTQTPSPCTVIALCPGPLHLPVHPCTVPVHRYRALPRSPAPSRAPVHRPRAPLSLAAPVPCTFPCAPVHRYRALPGPLHPYTVPVHRYRALPRSPSPAHRPRAPSRSQPCRIT